MESSWGMSRMGLYPMKIDKEFLSLHAFKHLKSKSIYILWNKKAKVSKIMIIFAVVFSRKKFEGQSG